MQHSWINDLLWCVESSEVVLTEQSFFHSNTDTASFSNALNEIAQSNPGLMLNVIKQHLFQLKTRRLGDRFEAFWRAAIELHPDYSIVVSNFPLRWQGKTLGELDLVIEQHSTGKYFHLELTCKFYLQIPDRNDFTQWMGPGQADRLDKKLARLQTHQLTLLEDTRVQQVLYDRHWPAMNSYCVIKGRLFKPLTLNGSHANDFSDQEDALSTVNTNAISGYWVTRKQMSDVFSLEQYRWYELSKPEWFSTPELNNGSELSEIVNENINRPKQMVGYCEQKKFCEQQKEVVRIFLVEDDWLNKAKLKLEDVDSR